MKRMRKKVDGEQGMREISITYNVVDIITGRMGETCMTFGVLQDVAEIVIEDVSQDKMEVLNLLERAITLLEVLRGRIYIDGSIHDIR